MRPSRKRLARFVSAAPLMLLACSSPEQPSESLGAAEVKWNAAGLHSYDYVVAFRCGLCAFPIRPVSVKVRSDTISILTYVDDGSPVDPALLHGHVSILGTFRALRQVLSYDPEIFTAVYDPSFGYPRQVHVDRHAHVADDEMSFELSAFRPIGP